MEKSQKKRYIFSHLQLLVDVRRRIELLLLLLLLSHSLFSWKMAANLVYNVFLDRAPTAEDAELEFIGSISHVLSEDSFESSETGVFCSSAFNLVLCDFPFFVFPLLKLACFVSLPLPPWYEL